MITSTESMFYNIWTDPISLLFYGFCAVFLMTNIKPLIEMLLKDWKERINQRSESSSNTSINSKSNPPYLR